MKITRKWQRNWKRQAAAAVLAISMCVGPSVVYALPTGGTVVGGSGTVQTNGSTMTVTQTTDRLAMNWQQFNIAAAETVRFNQPSTSSVVLNRVVGSDASAIYGKLSANGQVIVTNPNGIIFGPTAQVDVGGLVASSLHISDTDFMNGRMVFNKTGSNIGEVINHGNIRVADGGYVALLGDKVTNEGIIIANKGTVALAAGGGVTLDFSGDGLINLAVSSSTMDVMVQNKNFIQADGGKVVMTTRAAGDLVSSVVNNSGIIRAQGMAERNGKILLDAGTGGIAQTGGTLNASSVLGTGGLISVLGDKVGLLDDALLDVSGVTGGGTILAGGNFQGKGPEQNATVTYVAPTVVLKADAVTRGDGGKVVVWADNTTRFFGTLSAKGGSYGGNGGNAEVSGKLNLTFDGNSNLLAPKGAVGTLLLDPGNVYIDDAASPDPTNMNFSGTRWFQMTSVASDSYISSSTIQNNLAGGNVTIYTSNGANPGGNLYVNSPISYWGNNTLNLYKANDGYNMYINASISVKNLQLQVVGISSPASVSQSAGTITAENLTLALSGSKVSVSLPQAGNQLGNVYITNLGGDPVMPALTLRNESVNPTLTFQNNSVATNAFYINGPMSLTHTNGGISLQGLEVNGDLNLNAAGAITQQDLSSEAGRLKVGGTTTLTAPSTGNITLTNPANDFATLTVPSAQNLSIVDANNIAIGAVSTTGPIDIKTVVGGLYVTAAIATADASPSAVVLTAGKDLTPWNSKTKDTDTSNVVFGGSASISTGAGGRVLLYTGAIPSTPTALEQYAGSGHFRYNSTASAVNYTAELGQTGAWVIYRQQPELSMILAVQYITYGEDPKTDSNYLTISGNINGDTSAAALGGASYTFASYDPADKSTSGHLRYTPNKDSIYYKLVDGASYYYVDITTSINGSSPLGYKTRESPSWVWVKRKEIGGTLTSPVVKEYDGTTAANAAGAVGVISGDVVTLTSTKSEYAGKNVGTGIAVTLEGLGLSGADAGTYNLISNTASGNVGVINARSLTAALAGAVTKTYNGNTDATLAAGNYSLTGGVVSGETVTLNNPNGMYDNCNVGTSKTVSVNGLALIGADAGNYTLNGGTTTLSANIGTITAKPITITPDNGQTMVYDGLAPNPTLTYTSTGLVAGDSFTGALALTSPSRNAASYAINRNTLAISDGNSGNNYAFTFTTGKNYTVTARPLAINAVTNTKTYDGDTTAVATPTVTGIQTGDSVTGLIQAYADKNAGTGNKTLNVSAWTVNDNNSGHNYTVTTNSFTTGTITTKPITITPDDGQTMVYNGLVPNPTLTYANTGLATGDSFSGALALTDPTRNIGSYGINRNTLAVSDGNGGNNYAFTFTANKNYTVTARPLTINAITNTKTYDGDITAAAIPTVTGTQTGDSITGLVEAYTNKTAGVGFKTLTVTGYTVNDGNGGNNYAVTTVPFTTATINKKNITAALTGTIEKEYDTTTLATMTDGSYVLPGVVTGDAVTLFKPSFGTYDTKNVGVNKTVTVNALVISGADAANYNLTTASINGTVGTITPATLTYNSVAATRFQGTPDPAFTGSVTGFKGTETLTDATTGAPLFTSTTTAGTPPGNYPIDGSGLTAKFGNYIFVQNAANATALRVNENDKTKEAIKKSDDGGNPPPPPAPPAGGGGNPGGSPALANTPSGGLNLIPGGGTTLTVTQTGGQGTSYGLSVSGDTVTLNPTGGNTNITLPTGGAAVALVTPGAGVSYFNASSTGSGLSLSNAPTPPVQNVPPPPAASSAATGTFQMTAGDGSTASFQLTYANGALAIQPMNDTAAGMTAVQGNSRTILVAAGMMAAAEKLGVNVGDVAAVYVNAR